MVEVMQFIFQDFWHWAGTVIIGDSPHCADFIDADKVCEEWEGRNEDEV